MKCHCHGTKCLKNEYGLSWDSWIRVFDSFLNAKIPIKLLTLPNNKKLIKYELME